jgi:hypothetical protein
MSYFQVKRLSPLPEYCSDFDDSDDSTGSPHSTINNYGFNTNRLQFELDRKSSTDILKGMGVGIIIGLIVGVCISKNYVNK